MIIVKFLYYVKKYWCIIKFMKYIYKYIMDNIEFTIKEYHRYYVESRSIIERLARYDVKLQEINKATLESNEEFTKFKKFYKNEKITYYEKLFGYYQCYRDLTIVLANYFLQMMRINFSEVSISGTSVVEVSAEMRRIYAGYKSLANRKNTFNIIKAPETDYKDILKVYRKYNNLYATDLIVLLGISDENIISELTSEVFKSDNISFVKKPWLYKMDIVETMLFSELCDRFKLKSKDINGFIKLYKKPVLLFDKRYKNEDIISYNTGKLFDKSKAETERDGININIIDRYRIMETTPASNKGNNGVHLTKKMDEVLYIETDGYLYKYKHIKISEINALLNKFSAYNTLLNYDIRNKDFTWPTVSEEEVSEFYSEVLAFLNKENAVRMTDKYAEAMKKAVESRIKTLQSTILGVVTKKFELQLLLENEISYHVKKVQKYIIENKIRELKDLTIILKPFIHEFVTGSEIYFIQ